MAAKMEDDVHVAVPDHVHVVFGVFLFDRTDDLCVYATHPEGEMEREFQCKSEDIRISPIV